MIDKINYRPTTHKEYSFGYFAVKESYKENIEKTWGWNTKFQKEYYRKNFHTKNSYIIELDGIKIGLLNYVETIDNIEISAIYILPKYQNKGIGTIILTKIINIGKNKNIPINLQVLKTNTKAKELYYRVGFKEYEQTDTHIKMKIEWK